MLKSWGVPGPLRKRNIWKGLKTFRANAAIMLFICILLCCFVFYCILLYFIVFFCILLCFIVLYFILLCFIVLYCSVIYCICIVFLWKQWKERS